MAIQIRRGALANLDKSKLVAGEIVVATDEDYVGVAKAPSQVIQLATTDMLDLPVASENTLGGVKVGNNLSIDPKGVLSANSSGVGTHIRYTQCSIGKYYNIYEGAIDVYEWPRVISVIGKSGSYEGNEKNFYVCFNWNRNNNVVCYGIVSNDDYPSNFNIIATYDNYLLRLYIQSYGSQGYIDAYINASTGTVYTDSVAENEMTGAVKCKLTDITPITKKMSISDLKDIVADSSDFADFQSRIADL